MNDVADAVLDEVMDALGDMVERTCPTMRVLWLAHSIEARSEIVSAPLPMPEYPEYLLRPGRAGMRSKYRALAGWRHVVVWRALDEHANAMTTIYFQPYPTDEPPYSYARRTSSAPGVSRDTSVAHLRKRAAEEIQSTIELIAGFEANSTRERFEKLFIDLGRTKRLRDVLKLEGTSADLFAEG